MKIYKKAILLLCLLLAVGIFSGCGEESNITADTTSQAPENTSITPDAEQTETINTTEADIETKVESIPVAETAAEEDKTIIEQEEAISPESKLLPDIRAFTYQVSHSERKLGNGAWYYLYNAAVPNVAYEPVKEEFLNLFADQRYQLELAEHIINPHYIGVEMHDYYYIYTGTSEDIELLIDEYEEHEFHVFLRLAYHPDEGYFKFYLTFSGGFELEDPGTRTTRDLRRDSDGGIITEAPEIAPDKGSSGIPNHGDYFIPNASKLDCLTCRGDGDCNTCGGDGYTGFGDAKAGCRTCHGNGKCKTCHGTGKR